MTTVSAAGALATNNFGDTRSGGLAGPMGLLVILALAGATIFLIRNMNARLRRLPERFPDQAGQPTTPAPTGQPRAHPAATSSDPTEPTRPAPSAPRSAEASSPPRDRP
jgi:predicted lipid-binding transport protein (Tim44 family)